MSTSSHFAYLIEEIRNSWSLLRMILATDIGVYYPKRYYYSPSNLDAFALAPEPWPLAKNAKFYPEYKLKAKNKKTPVFSKKYRENHREVFMDQVTSRLFANYLP